MDVHPSVKNLSGFTSLVTAMAIKSTSATPLTNLYLPPGVKHGPRKLNGYAVVSNVAIWKASNTST